MKKYYIISNYKNLFWLVFTFSVLYIFVSCLDSTNNPESINNNVFPIPDQIDDGWETASILSVGLNENGLNQ